MISFLTPCKDFRNVAHSQHDNHHQWLGFFIIEHNDLPIFVNREIGQKSQRVAIHRPAAVGFPITHFLAHLLWWWSWNWNLLLLSSKKSFFSTKMRKMVSNIGNSLMSLLLFDQSVRSILDIKVQWKAWYQSFATGWFIWNCTAKTYRVFQEYKQELFSITHELLI